MGFVEKNNIKRLVKNLIRHQKRIGNIDYNQTRHFCVIRLVKFIRETPELAGIIEELESTAESVEEINSASDSIVAGTGGKDFDNESQFLLRSFLVLEKCSEGGVGAENRAAISASLRPTRHDVNHKVFSSVFVEPVVSYLIDKLQDTQATTSALISYKQRVEWFRKKQYRELIEASGTRRIEEEILNPRIYEYLHNAGVEFYIEPQSQQMRGRPDLITSQGSSPKLILDGKYLPSEAGARRKIIEAFSQVYKYTVDFNRPVGYIVIFKNFDGVVKFDFTVDTQGILFINKNNKRIYFLVIDIFDSPPTSTSGKLKEITINEKDLAADTSE